MATRPFATRTILDITVVPGLATVVRVDMIFIHLILINIKIRFIFFFLGTGWQYCSCDSCKDFKQNPGYSYPTKTWWDWADGSDKGGRCGPTAPKIDVNGQSIYPTCNHGSNGAYCCSKWGNCGSGAGFCDCDDCVDFKQNPFFRWPTK